MALGVVLPHEGFGSLAAVRSGPDREPALAVAELRGLASIAGEPKVLNARHSSVPPGPVRELAGDPGVHVCPVVADMPADLPVLWADALRAPLSKGLHWDAVNEPAEVPARPHPANTPASALPLLHPPP